MQPKEGTRLSYALFHFFSVCVFGGVSHTHQFSYVSKLGVRRMTGRTLLLLFRVIFHRPDDNHITIESSLMTIE